ncbi:unnamed protein product, partial [marine sediment metagenome]
KAEKMTHRIPCNAYSFVKKGQARIDKKKLKRTGIPLGPLIRKLKEGKNVKYKSKTYRAKNLTFQENSKKVSIVLDTSFNKKITSFVKNSDVLICEATFMSSLKDMAKERYHLTVKQVAEIAKKSKSKKLFLIHISQRYSRELKKVLAEAKKTFRNSHIPKDLDFIKI